MQQRKFRKLNIEVPVQPLQDQRPWLFGGLLLTVIFLLGSVYDYLKYKGRL
ncbi:MAG: hypothetical protein ACTHJ5_09080 [Ilyomonas sp.]